MNAGSLKHAVVVLLILFLGLLSTVRAEDTNPSAQIGAKVYQQRCVLCHGSQAMGEGILPMKLKGYPNTNLLQRIRQRDEQEIQNIVTHGASLDSISDYMPPMGAELSWTELESVVDFLMLLKEDTDKGLSLLASVNASSSEQSIFAGRDIYETRCVLCHGASGKGDGRMSKIIKSPPPFNLTLSRLPKEYLIDIVTKGGEGMKRSGQMPPWGDQLTQEEIGHVVDYIVTLRKK